MRRLLLLLTLLLIQALLAPTVAACSPPAVTPWFVERVEVDEAQLPEGVTVRSPDQERIVVTNTTPTELYLLSEPDTYPHPYPQLAVELPERLVPTHNIVEGSFFEWSWRLGDDTTQEIWEWRKGVGAYPELWVTQNRIEGGHFQLSLDQRNLNGDSRPDDAPLPRAQATQLLLVYDSHLLRVPLTISYELNPNYDPRSVEHAANACRTIDLLPPVLIFAVMVVLLAIPMLLKWGWRRWRAARS